MPKPHRPYPGEFRQQFDLPQPFVFITIVHSTVPRRFFSSGTASQSDDIALTTAQRSPGQRLASPLSSHLVIAGLWLSAMARPK